ncbi:MAG: peptidoglycan DD-metalloendopeptidase family protein, partial [bacterium]|nr:peptidoglycan DD-metalloendopeptidase family protein [bacterium]
SLVNVYVGQYVSQGHPVGGVGSSGNSTGCHVHFEIRGAAQIY